MNFCKKQIAIGLNSLFIIPIEWNGDYMVMKYPIARKQLADDSDDDDWDDEDEDDSDDEWEEDEDDEE